MESKILIITNEDGTRKKLHRMLTEAGFATDVAANGAVAKERLSEDDYDVALVDLQMQDIDDVQVSSLEWMQIHAPNVIPIVLTGITVVEDALKAVQQGAFDFVTRPIETPVIVAQQIHRAVNHKRLKDNRDQLIQKCECKNEELEKRLDALERAHELLQEQSSAIQVDLNRAMRIQQGLLPKRLPFPDWISFSALYRPMQQVGGDLYDLFQIDDQHIGLYIADASGHGVSSAMLTVFLKHAVQEILCLGGEGHTKTPGEFLRELNQIIMNEEFGQGVFVSMAYLVFDVRTLLGQFSNAGHPPLLIKRDDGTVERIRRPAPVLGINPNVTYTDEEFSLYRGDALILYTDGITDAQDVAGGFFGDDRLEETVSKTPCHVDDLTEAIEWELEQFCEGSKSTDDATFLALGAEPQKYAFSGHKEEPVDEPEDNVNGIKVTTARHDGRVFICVAGAGSWRESQQVMDLCEQARRTPERFIVLDLKKCSYLDSTFLGVLHNISTEFESDPYYRFEIQNAPIDLLREMSELGLTTVLMHFRPEPVPLPETMRPVLGGIPVGDELGHLLLWAHEALVEADPNNEQRFGSVLKVLKERAKKSKS